MPPRDGAGARARPHCWRLPLTALVVLTAALWSATASADHSPGHGKAAGGMKKGQCDKTLDLDSEIRNAQVVAVYDTVICSNTDLDLYRSNDRLFAVVSGGEEAAFTVIDVTEPNAPKLEGQFLWPKTGARGTSADKVQAFHPRGGSADTLFALGVSRDSKQGLCGVMFITPEGVAAQRIDGLDADAGDSWCNVNGLFVENDGDGNGAFVYVAASETFDLRVFDIRDIAGSTPTEVGRYRRGGVTLGRDSNGNAHGQNDPDGPFDDILVNDVFVADALSASGQGSDSPVSTVYVAYMAAGLDIFPASLVRDDSAGPGAPPLSANQKSFNADGAVVNLTPEPHASGAPFVVYQAIPDAIGETVFLRDEASFAPGDMAVQAWDIVGGAGLLDGLEAGVDIPALPPHDLAFGVLNANPESPLENRLTVGWYHLGLEGWDFGASGFDRVGAEPRTAEVFHQARTGSAEDPRDGAWAVEIARIGELNYGFAVDHEFGLIVVCLGADGGTLEACPESPPAVP
jgi:hypothetical protein